MLHLLPIEIIAIIISWMNRYSNVNDSTVTLLCFKYTSHKMKNIVTWKSQLNIKEFLEKLLSSDIYNFHILDWLIDGNVIPYLETMKYTIKCNDIERLQYYQSKGYIFDVELTRYAAETNRLQFLQYLYQYGY